MDRTPDQIPDETQDEAFERIYGMSIEEAATDLIHEEQKRMEPGQRLWTIIVDYGYIDYEDGWAPWEEMRPLERNRLNKMARQLQEDLNSDQQNPRPNSLRTPDAL